MGAGSGSESESESESGDVERGMFAQIFWEIQNPSKVHFKNNHYQEMMGFLLMEYTLHRPS